ncbi:MAG: hypothetical protein QOF16_155 [Actinomycetota bacterium]|nr:hypothetical protein [Actinomycetota bacterium]
MSIINRKIGVLVVLAMATSLLMVVAPTGARGAPTDCPTIAPASEVHNGMTGYGLTVSQGTTPERFSVKFLGVLKDGIAPGIDLIIVDTSSPAIDNAGGIWAGMSGSPVYTDDDRLIGAVSYSLSYGPSSIAGLTPAEDMQQVLQYTDKPEPGRHSGYYYGYARTSNPGAAMRQRIAATSERRASTVGNFKLMRTPVSFSGLSAKGMRKVSAAIKKNHLPFIPYSGSSASSDPAAQGTTPQPGDNFAATLSYGDITAAGIGTATFDCNGKTVAFGHPFFFSGPTAMGANQADAITIISDPTFGNYKLANVTGTIGTVDQDRLSAIRADLSTAPPTIPITSSFTATDYGRTRQGESDVVLQDFIPDITLFHMAENLAVVFDQEAGGSSSINWTVTGTRADGSTWQLNRSDLFASDYDIPFSSFYELLDELYSIEYNRFENVTFTGISASGSVQKDANYYKITHVQWSTDGSNFKGGRHVHVAPGDIVSLQVTLSSEDGAVPDKVVAMSLQIPDKRVRSGEISITGGARSSRSLCFGGRGCGRDNRPKSFDELLAQLQDAPHNNDLTASLLMGSGLKGQDVETQDRVVNGRRLLFIEPKGSHSHKKTITGSSGSGSSGGGHS